MTDLEADYAKGPVVTGLSLSHSRGLGEYAGVRRRPGGLVGDGPVPVAGLQGNRARHGVGRGRLGSVGLRHDGGDAETGAGMDVGGGLVVSDASTGLAIDVRVRMLVMHQARGSASGAWRSL